MNRSTLLIAIILPSVLLLFSSCKGDKTIVSDKDTATQATKMTTETAEKASDPTILFFGNSLTAGYGLDPEESFPSRIEDIVDSLGVDYKIVNAGLSGETTSGGLNRIDWVLSQRVDVFVLELGANDMLRGLPLDETKKNLKAIIDRVKSKYPQAKIVLAEMLAAPNMGEDYATAFRQIYGDLSKSEEVALMPFFLQGVADKPELILPDGKHPNANGQKIVADYIWKYLQQNVL